MEEKELIGSVERFWQDPYDTQWIDSGTPATATVKQDNAVTLLDTGDEPALAGSQDLTVAVLVPHSASGWETGIVQLTEGRKYLFRHGPGPKLIYASGRHPFVIEVLEEDIGYPDDVVSSIPPCPRLWHLEETQPANWRGAFYPTYPRKVLFSKTVTLETAKLPRWKPNTAIHLRTFESKDD